MDPRIVCGSSPVRLCGVSLRSCGFVVAADPVVSERWSRDYAGFVIRGIANENTRLLSSFGVLFFIRLREGSIGKGEVGRRRVWYRRQRSRSAASISGSSLRIFSLRCYRRLIFASVEILNKASQVLLSSFRDETTGSSDRFTDESGVARDRQECQPYVQALFRGNGRGNALAERFPRWTRRSLRGGRRGSWLRNSSSCNRNRVGRRR